MNKLKITFNRVKEQGQSSLLYADFNYKYCIAVVLSIF